MIEYMRNWIKNYVDSASSVENEAISRIRSLQCGFILFVDNTYMIVIENEFKIHGKFNIKELKRAIALDIDVYTYKIKVLERKTNDYLNKLYHDNISKNIDNINYLMRNMSILMMKFIE